MASKQEHLRASKVLLGHADPLVHNLMDRDVRLLGYKYRYLNHNMEYVHNIGKLLGKEAELEAFLHLLVDMGLVARYDYRKKRKRTRKLTTEDTENRRKKAKG